LSNTTLPRLRDASAMLVGIDAALVEPITQALSMMGFRVLVVAHAAAASERIPVVMPRVVVVTSRVLDAERDDLRDRVVAVGAELVWMPAGAEEERALALVRDAAAAALERSSRQA
jgi:hypothetical protein